MSAIVYPAGLPCPDASTITKVERRALGVPERPRDARPLQRDRSEFERVTWPAMTRDQSDQLLDWWRDTLQFGGAWFTASWPSPRGVVPIVRKLFEQPRWVYVAGSGGMWRLSALCEVRGVGLAPNEAAPPPPPPESRMLVQRSRMPITPPDNERTYNAWPCSVRLANGDILVGYTSTVAHHSSNEADGVVKRSTDNGATWGSEIVVMSHVPFGKGVNLYGLGQSSTGRVFAVLWDDNAPFAGGGTAYICYSDDNGETWSAPIDVTAAAGMTGQAFGCGRVLDIGGTLLATIEGVNSGQTFPDNDRTVVIQSVDDGLTWTLRATVASPAIYPGRFYAEPSLFKPTSGSRLYCFMRTGSNEGDQYVSYSDDDGLTWSAPTEAFQGVSPANVIEMESGLWVSAVRQGISIGGRAIVYASADSGATWVRSFVDDPGYETVYCTVQDRLDGTVLIIYSNEVVSGATCSVVSAIAVPVSADEEPIGDTGANVDILDNLTAQVPTGGGAALGAVAFSGASHLQAEITISESVGGDRAHMVGIGQAGMDLSTYPGAGAGGLAMYLSNGQRYDAGASSAYAASGDPGDCYGLEWVGDGSFRLWRNGVDLGALGTGLSGEWFPAWGPATSGAGPRSANFNLKGPFLYPITGASPVDS